MWYLSFRVGRGDLAELLIGQLKDLSEIARLHGGQSLLVREELYLSEVLVLLEVANVRLSFFVEHCH